MSKRKIVLIEDDEILAKVMVQELKDAGFAVSHAADGEAGAKMVQLQKPDLVLLDLLLPKKHGFEVLEMLKGSPTTKEIAVIIITQLGADADVKKGIQLGAEDYLVKSQHAVAEVIEKVKEFMSGR